MKTILVIILILVFIIPCAVWSQKEPENFRGIKWGADISEVSDLLFITESGDMKFYSRKGEENKIGDADVEFIRYHFYKNRFCTASIKFNGYGNFRLLREALIQKYGAGSKPNQFLEKYTWILGDIWMIFQYSEVQKAGSIFYYYNPIWKQVRVDEKEAAKKTKDGL